MATAMHEPGADSPASAPYSTRMQAALVALMLLVYVVASVDKLVVFLLVGLIREDMGITDFQMSFVLSTAFGVAFALGSLPFGYLADRIDRRKQIFLALLAWSCFSMACGFAGGFLALLVLRAGVGLAESAFPAARDSLVADAVPPAHLGIVNAVLTSGGVVGGGIALIIGGLVTGLASGTEFAGFDLRPWQVVFLITGATGFVLLPFLLILPDPGRTRRVVPGLANVSGFGELLRNRWRFYLGTVGAAGMLSMMSNSSTAWAPAYLDRALGVSAMEAGVTLGIVQTSAILIGFFGCGWGIDHFYRKGYRRIHLIWTLIAALIGIPIGAVAYMLPTTLLFFGGYWLFYAVHLGYAVALIAIVQIETPSQYRGRAAALLHLAITIVGFGIGPTFVAAVTDFVLGDAALVGRAVSIVICGSGLAGALFLLLALSDRPRVETSHA